MSGINSSFSAFLFPGSRAAPQVTKINFSYANMYDSVISGQSRYIANDITINLNKSKITGRNYDCNDRDLKFKYNDNMEKSFSELNKIIFDELSFGNLQSNNDKNIYRIKNLLSRYYVNSSNVDYHDKLKQNLIDELDNYEFIIDRKNRYGKSRVLVKRK